MECLSPIKIGENRMYPCRKCVLCKRIIITEWATRISCEAYHYKNGAMITLTYNDENLPNKEELSKPDLQKFIKRFRHKNDYPDIKYFAVGEYGETVGRPHYHILMLYDDIYIGDAEEIWGKGLVHIGQINEKTIRYVIGYLEKESPMIGDRAKEFHIMSKGIGLRYAQNNIKQIIQDGGIRLQNGYIKNTPRYYLDKLFGDDLKYLNLARELDNFDFAKDEEDWEKRTREGGANLWQKKQNIEAKYNLKHKKDLL